MTNPYSPGAGAGLRGALSSALQRHVARLARRTQGKKMLRALKIALSFSAKVDADGSTTFGLSLGDIEAELADSGDIELDLATLVDGLAVAASDVGTGLAELIDEAQDLTPEELTALQRRAPRIAAPDTRAVRARRSAQPADQARSREVVLRAALPLRRHPRAR